MLIIIISDIHDNQTNLAKSLAWAKEHGCEELICCGDVTNDDTLKFLACHFSGPVHLVAGNMELYEESEVAKYKNIKYYGRLGRFKLDAWRVGLCHEPYLIGKVLEQGACDIIFYGHTHKPWQKKDDGQLIVNPGNVAGVLNRATFAAWDTKEKKIELIILDALKACEK